MNFLKKRLKSHKKGHHDDDDDLDYIPPVPPHPSEIAKIQEQQKQDLLTSAVPPEDPATVIAKKKINKDKEEWKFFEKLTAKVEETVVQTQSNLDKIKETSTAEEIANKPDIEEVELTEEEKFFEQSESKIVARDLNSWVPLDKEKTEDSQAQSETADNNNSAREVEEDQPVKGKKKPPPKPKPPKPPLPADTAQTEVASSSQDNTSGPQTSSTFPLLDSDTCGPNSHSENPLDDFGFGGEPANTLTSSELIFDYENDYLDDPFDTSFVNISIPEPVKYEPTDRKEKFSALISQLSLNKESTNNHRTRNSKSDHRRQESISHNFISSSSNHNRDSSFANTSETHDFDPIPSTNSIIKPNLSEITESKNTSRNQQPLSPQPLSPTINRTIGSSSSPPILSPQHPPSSTTAQAFSQPIEDTDLDLPFLSNKLGRSSGSRYGSNTSIASIMSNPFLVDTEYYTPTMGSGTTTPFSGTATPRRRNSTNPFEQSPEEEYPINIEASAIAAMTEDFQKAIGGTTDDQEDTGVISASDRGSLTMPEPFDPFATIHDDYIETPKRQSVSKVSTTATDGSMGADDVFEFGNTNLNSALDKSSSNYRRDLDDLDVIDAKINIIDNEKINTYDSSKPISGMKLGNTNLLEMPDTSGADYLSDISDTDEPYHSNDEHSDDASSVRKSSAFQMDLIEKDKDEPPPKFDPLPADAVIKRKLSIPIEPRIEDDSSGQTTPEIPASGSRSSITHHTTSGSTIPFFDPFSTVIDKDSPSSPKVIGFSSGFIDSITKTIQERSLNPDPIDSHDSSPTVEKNYLDYSGVKNVSDQVLPSINDEDSENLSKLNEISTQATCSVPQTQGISRTSDTFAASEVTTHDNYEAGSDSGLAVSSSGLDNDPTDPGRDPFDTSEFMESTKDSVPFTDAASFDAFQTRFDQTSDQRTSEIGGLDSSAVFDPFASPANKAKGPIVTNIDDQDGFDVFDPFASSPSIRTPKNTPRKAKTGPQRPPRPDDDDDEDDDDDDEADNFRVVIRSKDKTGQSAPSAAKGLMPLLPPPPKPTSKAFQDPLGDGESVKKKKEEDIDEFEAFFGKGLNNVTTSAPRNEAEWTPPGLGEAATKRTDSLESPSTPLFDDDVSQPLEDFPPKYEGDGWDMFIRHPAKKKLTGNRYWKKVFVRLSENSVIQLYNKKEDKEPFQELPLQPCYSLSEISSQQYDQYGKIFTIKLQYIFYRERVGVRKGQIAKVMQGQITSVGGLAKLGMPLEHAPQVSQLIKIGSLNYEDLQVFTYLVEEAFFRMVIHRDRALTYKTEEIQVTVVDEYYVETTKTGLITKQLARVRLFMLAFINGMPTVEVGVNDMTRQGKEVVGRHDIIPVVTEEWIRLEAVEFHSSVDKEEFEKETRLIKVVPPDACFFELMRFRVRPPKQRELPLQVTANLTLTKAKVELRCEVLVPGCVSRKYGQIPCEDIAIRIHIPECWIYFFRTEKHLRYGSVKSTSRRPGKIKGIERFLGTTQNFEPTMLETSAGSAKYEHAFHSLVWRIPKLPKEGQGAYTQQLLVCRLPLTSFDQVPDKFYEFVHIEFTMPSTTVSHAVVRSISVSPTGENPPEKYVRNIAKHEYKTDLVISYKENDAPGNSYNLAPVNPHPNHSSPAAEPEKQANVEDSDDSD